MLIEDIQRHAAKAETEMLFYGSVT